MTTGSAAKRRRAETVERLLDAALETFAEIGFAAASVEDICRRGGFTRGAFYSSFRTKDELFAALFARETARNLARAEQQLAGIEHEADPVDRGRRAVPVHVPGRPHLGARAHRVPPARRPAPRGRRALREPRPRRCTRRLTALIETAAARAGVRLAVPADRLARIVLALHDGVVIAPGARPAHRRSRPPPTSSAPPSSCCSAPPTRLRPTDPEYLFPMAPLLARLGRASFRHRGLVAVAWLAVLGAVVALLAHRSAARSTTSSPSPARSRRTRSTSSTRPRPARPASGAQIVFVAPDGQTVTDPAVAAAIEQVVAAAGRAPQVAAAVSPFDSQAISPDGGAALATVQYDVPREDLDADEPRRAAGDHRRGRGRRPGGRRRRQRLRHHRRRDRRHRVHRRRCRRPRPGAHLRLAAGRRDEPADRDGRHRRSAWAGCCWRRTWSRCPRARRRSR